MYVPCNKINNQTYTCTKRYKEQICMYASPVEICMLHPKEVLEKVHAPRNTRNNDTETSAQYSKEVSRRNTR